MQPLPDLPKTRRLVTGHSPDGKAIFEHDEALTPVNPVPQNVSKPALKAGFTLIHRTSSYPVRVQGGAEEFGVENLRRGQGEKGIVCQIVDVPPPAEGHGRTVFLHRNQSLDYGVVMKGCIELVLDDGAEETIKEGEVFVQRGTVHGWRNPGPGWCRFFTVVIPSEQVRVERTGETLEATKIPGLSD